MMAVSATLARISDPRFGGTYMTLLNSINNVGNFWPGTVCLWLMDHLTIRSCGIGKAEVRRVHFLLSYQLASSWQGPESSEE